MGTDAMAALLALLAFCIPMLLAWFLVVREDRRDKRRDWRRK